MAKDATEVFFMRQMQINLFLSNVGDLVDFLEAEIAAGRNPTNPEEWDAFMKRMREAQKCLKIDGLPPAGALTAGGRGEGN